MIIYTRLLWFSGAITINQCLIIINSKYRNDYPLLKHEQEHQYQMKSVGAITFWWRYLTDKSFRQSSEVEAYRIQIKYGAPIEKMANHLSSGYLLGISKDYALQLLRSGAAL